LLSRARPKTRRKGRPRFWRRGRRSSKGSSWRGVRKEEQIGDKKKNTFKIEAPPDPPIAAIEGSLSGEGKRFAIVVSRFNAFITERLFQSAYDALLRSGVKKKDIDLVRVPGAFEIPSAARTLAETGKYDAIICIGCLLRGDTAHYDVIVNECGRGIGQSAQETGVPHAFGVLTCDTLEQAIDRAGLKMGNKGFEAAMTAIEMANLKKAVISRQSSGFGPQAAGVGKKERLPGSRGTDGRNPEHLSRAAVRGTPKRDKRR
jgi:6,7-dimethyl-8-ribityllumazine synthase